MATGGSRPTRMAAYKKHLMYSMERSPIHITNMGPSNTAQVVTLLFCVREVPGLNLGRDTNSPEVSHGFPYSLQANARAVPQPTASLCIISNSDHSTVKASLHKQYTNKYLSAFRARQHLSHSHSSEADSRSVHQETPRPLWNPKFHQVFTGASHRTLS
jgi:hypothetical protein